MPDAELEISIQRRTSGYTADARFTSPDHDVQPAAEVPLALDLAALSSLYDDPAAYGRLLSTQLFADVRLRSAWQQARAVAQQRNTLRLRLRLAATDADLHSLRWELLRDPEDDTSLALNERVRLSRYLESTDFTPLSLPLRPDLRALVVIANPSDLHDYELAEVDVDGEVARARAALGDIPTTILGDHPDAGGRATLPAISAALREGPHILLLICHGALIEGATILWLEGADGTSAQVPGGDFVQTVTQLRSRPLLIVLATCQSAGSGYGNMLAALGPRLARAGVAGVLAFQGNVAMATVKRLLPPLFTELRRDGSIDRALAAARGAIRQQADWWQALLWLRVRNGQLWQLEPTGPLLDVATDVRGLPNPYLGLKPFAYDDRGRFAGREDVVDASVARLATPGAQQTVLFITGASGSGKSSLAKAGIVPALEAAYAARHIPTQRAVMRPGTHPLAALGAALDGLSWPLSGVFAVADPFRFTKPAPPAGTPPINLLVLDQAEELFNPQIDGAQRDALIVLLSNLPPFADLRMHILVTLRADFLPNLFASPPLYQIAKGGIDLYAMTPAQLQEAIHRPIQVQYPAKRLEPALVARLAEDAAHDAALLPLLQVTLEDLWRRGRLILASYGDLTDALQARADAVMDYTDYDGGRQIARSEAERAAILAIFLDLVAVSLDDNATRDVRRRQHLSNLLGDRAEAGHRQQLIDELSQARLLAADGEMQDGREVTVVDIIHESLITRWPRLRVAIGERRDQLQARERFSLALAEWQQEGQADAYLLSGVRLAEAEALRERGDIVLAQPGADAFVTRSTRRFDDERRRQLQRTRAVAAVLGVLALLAIIAGGFAFDRQQAASTNAALSATSAANEVAQRVAAQIAQADAQTQAQIAQTAQATTEEQLRVSDSQRLAFAAQGQRDVNATIALLLAAEALARDANPITRDSLRQALDVPLRTRLRLGGHSGLIYSAAYSPDGGQIVTASSDQSAIIWDATSGEQLTTLQGHSAYVQSAAYSPDGGLIVTASWDDTAIIWDAASGAKLTTLLGHSAYVRSAAYSPNGAQIVTASRDRSAIIWDATSGAKLTTLLGHSGGVNSAAYSPDGGLIVTASDDNSAIIWDAASGAKLTTLLGHSANVWSAAYSPDGSQIVTASNDKSAIIWDAASGEQLITLREFSGGFNSAAYSPDGGQIVTASDNNRVIIWDAASGAKLTTLWGHSANVLSAAYSPDGGQIVTASRDRSAIIWDAASGEQLTTLQGHSANVLSAAYSPDGGQIVTASGDDTAIIWDAASGAKLTTLRGHSANVWSAAYSPNGGQIVTTSDDNRVVIWDAASGAKLTTLQGHSGPIYSAAYSPDGRQIITASWDNTAIIWDATSGAKLTTLQGHSGPIYSAAYSPDGRQIITASDDNSAIIWGATSGEQLITLQGHSAYVRSAAYSPNGAQIVTASRDRSAIIWDATSGAKLTTLQGHSDSVWSAAYSPDGRHIATASDDNSAIIWSAASGEQLITFQGHSANVLSAAYSPDGGQFVTASWDATAIIWSATSGEQLTTLQGHSDGVNSAAYSPNGGQIVTASRDRSAIIWDAASGEQLTTLRGHSADVLSAVYSPDGRHIVTTSWDGSAIIWDAASGAKLTTLRGHSAAVRSAAYSPDGGQIVTASWDNTAIIWDVTSGEQITTLQGHSDGVNSAAYSPNGGQIVTASTDGSAIIWDAASGEQITTLQGHSDSVRSAAYSPNGMRIVIASEDGTAIQYFVDDEDLLKVASCRLWRGFYSEEITRFALGPAPQFAPASDSQCSLVLSWEQAKQ
jgi:WD40 repeat protein